MPWYVYAIHQDHTRNRQYNEKPILDKTVADKLFKDMRAGCVAGDNYRVAMFEADDDEAAKRVADEKRPHPKLPPVPPVTGPV